MLEELQPYEWWSPSEVKQAEALKKEEYKTTFGTADEVAFAVVDCELVPFVVDYCIKVGKRLAELGAEEFQALLVKAEALLYQSKKWYSVLQGAD